MFPGRFLLQWWMAQSAVGGVHEAVPASMTAGILPVRVNIPAVGNIVTYTKTLPEPNGLLTLPLYHVAAWARAAGWILVLMPLLPCWDGLSAAYSETV
jgi:hypothetical protein